MSRNFISRSLVLAVCVCAPATVFAQNDSFNYDPPAEITVSGQILHVVSFPASDGVVGLHFDLQTSAGMVNVHVAPALFIGQLNVSYFADDKVDIVGVKAFIDGNTSFIARSITRDGKTLVLRLADGTPAWTPGVEGVDGCGATHLALPRGTER
jgi:hypothetical protein